METDNAIVPDQNLDTIFFKASAKIQLGIVKKYIKLHAKGERVKKFDVTIPGHTVSWWKLPKMESFDVAYKVFTRNISTNSLKDILMDIFHNNLTLGVEYFSKSLANKFKQIRLLQRMWLR